MNVEHGGDILGFAHENGIHKNDVYDFSSNINPLGTSERVKESYQNSFEEILKYPDTNSSALVQKIADLIQLKPNNILTGNGSIALIDLVIRCLKPRKALIVEPCFNEYKRLLQLSDCAIESIVLREEEGFQLPFEIILKEFNKTDILILGHPNNPTGTALSPDQLEYLIGFADEMNKTILVDEAFIDWHSHDSILSNIQNHSSLIVSRSLTKFYALAGIRAGYAVAEEKIIEKMRAYQETWNCNALAQKLAVAALNDEEFHKKSLNWFHKEHDFLFSALKQIPFIKVFPSKANFFLCKISEANRVKEFWQKMAKAGIYLRKLEDFVGLNEHYFRIALKTRRENIYFLKILNSINKNKSESHDRNILSLHS